MRAPVKNRTKKSLAGFVEKSHCDSMEWPGIKRLREDNAELVAELRGIIEGALLDHRPVPPPDLLAAEVHVIGDLVATHRAEITDLQSALERLTLAVSHGIEHEDRRERRIEATIRRARKQLAELGVEDAGLEAEFDGLSLHDGGGGEGGEVPSLRSQVEEGAEVEESSIKGVTQEQLRRARGF